MNSYETSQNAGYGQYDSQRMDSNRNTSYLSPYDTTFQSEGNAQPGAGGDMYRAYDEPEYAKGPRSYRPEEQWRGNEYSSYDQPDYGRGFGDNWRDDDRGREGMYDSYEQPKYSLGRSDYWQDDRRGDRGGMYGGYDQSEFGNRRDSRRDYNDYSRGDSGFFSESAPYDRSFRSEQEEQPYRGRGESDEYGQRESGDSSSGQRFNYDQGRGFEYDERLGKSRDDERSDEESKSLRRQYMSSWTTRPTSFMDEEGYQEQRDRRGEGFDQQTGKSSRSSALTTYSHPRDYQKMASRKDTRIGKPSDMSDEDYDRSRRQNMSGWSTRPVSYMDKEEYHPKHRHTTKELRALQYYPDTFRQKERMLLSPARSGGRYSEPKQPHERQQHGATDDEALTTSAAYERSRRLYEQEEGRRPKAYTKIGDYLKIDHSKENYGPGSPTRRRRRGEDRKLTTTEAAAERARAIAWQETEHERVRNRSVTKIGDYLTLSGV